MKTLGNPSSVLLPRGKKGRGYNVRGLPPLPLRESICV